MKLITLAWLLSLLIASPSYAAYNGACIAAHGNGYVGVCIHTKECTNAGGTYSTGDCPDDPPDVRCCTKPSCYNNRGYCDWTNECLLQTISGKSFTMNYAILIKACLHDVQGYCPGPASFKCCYE